jgi:capsular polysaccharide biosynthesis protein
MDFMKALRVLRGKKWTVIAVSLAAFVLVLAAPKPKQIKIAPIYKSKAKVLITPPSSNVRAYGGQAVQAADFSWFSDSNVLSELLKSEELLGRVVESSDANITPDSLAYAINIEPLSRSGRNSVQLFSLSVTDRDPKQAQKLTRLVTEEFVRYVEDLSAREFASTRRFIEELVLEAEGQRERAETSLMGIREKYIAAPSDEDLMMRARTIEARINEMERQISTTKIEVAALQDYQNGRSTSPPWQILSAENGSIAALQQNVATKKLDLVKLQDIYNDSNENVQTAKRQLTTAETLYQSAVDETVESLFKSKSSELQQAVGQRQSLNLELNNLLRARMSEDDRRLTRKYERELQVWEQNHLNLQQQLYQARVVEQSSRRSGAVNVLEQPGVGVVAANPNAPQPVMTQSTKKRAATAIPLCLLLGIAAAFLQEYLSSSTKLRPRVEEALEIPVLAVIPATPSELTVDWESFKRPDSERLAKMELASTRAPGFDERPSKVVAGVQEDSRESREPGSFGDQFRFRNQK